MLRQEMILLRNVRPVDRHAGMPHVEVFRERLILRIQYAIMIHHSTDVKHAHESDQYNTR